MKHFPSSPALTELTLNTGPLSKKGTSAAFSLKHLEYFAHVDTNKLRSKYLRLAFYRRLEAAERSLTAGI